MAQGISREIFVQAHQRSKQAHNPDRRLAMAGMENLSMFGDDKAIGHCLAARQALEPTPPAHESFLATRTASVAATAPAALTSDSAMPQPSNSELDCANSQARRRSLRSNDVRPAVADEFIDGQGVHGRHLGPLFQLANAPFIVARGPRKSHLSVTRCACELPTHIASESIPPEDGYLITLQVGERLRYGLRLAGRSVATEPLASGCLSFHDLRREPSFELQGPLDILCFYIDRKALDAIADEAGSARVGDLRHEPGRAVDDRTVRDLGFLLLPTFARPMETVRLFTDNVMLALSVHLAKTYGGMISRSRAQRGGLAPWQERRAKDILSANLDSDISLTRVAAECGLSKSYFSRAFRDTTGLAPHQWLIQYRVETARQMLEENDLPLVEVALACGFADQSHFTRVFSRMVGLGPGAWRRQHPARACGTSAPADQWAFAYA
jgi:AraC family transcriptional regulator